MRPRSATGVALVGLLALSACGGSGSGQEQDEAWFTGPTPTHTPVAVQGVTPCSAMPQSTPGGTSEVGLRRAVVGERLPALSLPCLTPGPDVDLGDLRGTPVLVNLWASWCDLCLREMPLLQQTHLEHGDEIVVIGVDTKDRPDAAAAFLDGVDVTYPQLVDLDGALLRTVGVPGLPVTLMLDRDGQVAARHVGELDRPSSPSSSAPSACVEADPPVPDAVALTSAAWLDPVAGFVIAASPSTTVGRRGRASWSSTRTTTEQPLWRHRADVPATCSSGAAVLPVPSPQGREQPRVVGATRQGHQDQRGAGRSSSWRSFVTRSSWWAAGSGRTAVMRTASLVVR